MRELLIEFIGKGEVKGFHFRQLDKTEKGYLYEVVTESGTHYEVFERRVNELSQIPSLSHDADPEVP